MENFSESFNRIKLLMSYDVSKTLIENLVYEQPDSVMDRRTGITDSNMKALGLDPYNPSDVKKYREMTDPAYNAVKTMKNYDVHDWFTLVQLTLLAAGFVTGGATAAIAFALEGVVSFAEAIVFFVKDKDPYMGVVMALLSILSIDDLKRIPIVKKYGIEGTAQLLKKYKEGIEKLTKQEIEDLKILGKYVRENAGEIIPLFEKGIKRLVLKYFAKKGAKFALNALYLIDKGKNPLFIAGTWIPFDYVYMYVYRDDIEKMNLRNKNVFVQIVQWVKNKLGGKEITAEEIVQNVEKRGVDYSTVENPTNEDAINALEDVLNRTGAK